MKTIKEMAKLFYPDDTIRQKEYIYDVTVQKQLDEMLIDMLITELFACKKYLLEVSVPDSHEEIIELIKGTDMQANENFRFLKGYENYLIGDKGTIFSLIKRKEISPMT